MKSIRLFLAFLLAALFALVFANHETKKSGSEAETPTEATIPTDAESGTSDFDLEQLMKLIEILKDEKFDDAMKMAGIPKSNEKEMEKEKESEVKEAKEETVVPPEAIEEKDEL
jgi:hypothetical protein